MNREFANCKMLFLQMLSYHVKMRFGNSLMPHKCVSIVLVPLEMSVVSKMPADVTVH